MKNIDINKYQLLVNEHNKKWSFICDKSEKFKSIFDAPNQRLFLDVPSEFRFEREINKNKCILEKDIKAALGYMGYSNIDIKNRVASNDGKNWTKIGKLLVKFGLSKLELKWKKYCNEYSVGDEKLKICVSLNPVDILTGSYNRKWKSCLSPTGNGDNYRYLAKNLLYPENYTFVAYFVKENDIEIENPLGRIYLHGYTRSTVNSNSKTESLNKDLTFIRYEDNINNKYHIYFALDTVYGRFPVKTVLKKYIHEMNKEIWDNRPTNDDVLTQLKCKGYYQNETKPSLSVNDLIYPIKLESNDTKKIDNNKLSGIDKALFDNYEISNKKYYGFKITINNCPNKSAFIITKLKSSNHRIDTKHIVFMWKKLKLYQKIQLLNRIPSFDITKYLTQSEMDEDTLFVLKNTKEFIKITYSNIQQEIINKQKELEILEQRLNLV